MSALIVPAIVGVGGVFLLYKALTKKKKSKHHSSSSSSSYNKTKKHRSSNSSSSSSSSDSDSSSSKTRSRSYGRYVKNKTKKTDKKDKDKNKEKKELTVFYTIGRVKGKKWSYNNMPSDWKVKTKGDAKYNSKYTQMVQFQGPNKNRKDMKRYIIKVFEYLKKKDIVKKFKMTSDTEFKI